MPEDETGHVPDKNGAVSPPWPGGTLKDAVCEESVTRMTRMKHAWSASASIALFYITLKVARQLINGGPRDTQQRRKRQLLATCLAWHYNHRLQKSGRKRTTDNLAAGAHGSYDTLAFSRALSSQFSPRIAR